MFKIIQQTPDELVMEKVPVIYYVLTVLLATAGVACFFIFPKIQDLGKITGIILLGVTVLLIIFLTSVTRVIIRKNKKAIYYIRTGLLSKKIKKYYFFEIADISIDNKTNNHAEITKRKCDIVLQKSSGKYKVLFHNNNKSQAEEVVNIIHNYLQLQ